MKEGRERERESEREILRERMKDLAYPPLPFSDHAEDHTTLSFYYKNSALSPARDFSGCLVLMLDYTIPSMLRGVVERE